MDEFPNRLRDLRLRHKPYRSTQVTSELMGLPPKAIQKYEAGIMKPSYEAIRAICEYYNVSADYLLGLKE